MKRTYELRFGVLWPEMEFYFLVPAHPKTQKIKKESLFRLVKNLLIFLQPNVILVKDIL